MISDSIQTPKTANDDATAVPLPNLLKQQVQELQISDSIQTPKTVSDDATAVPLHNLLKQQVQEGFID